MSYKLTQRYKIWNLICFHDTELNEAGKTDNYLISLRPFHILPASLMSVIRSRWRAGRGEEERKRREGEEAGVEEAHWWKLGAAEEPEPNSQRCVSARLERPGSKKLHIYFKRGGNVKPPFGCDSLLFMQNRRLFSLVVKNHFATKRGRAVGVCSNRPWTKVLETLLIVTMVTGRISHFTTGIERWYWVERFLLFSVFFYRAVFSLFKNKVGSHCVVREEHRRVSTSLSRPHQELS